MVHLLKKCSCRYTINQELEVCSDCNTPFRSAHPPKFSLHDRFFEYRRRMREFSQNNRE